MKKVLTLMRLCANIRSSNETKEIQEVEKQMILNEKGNEKLKNFENMLNEKEAVLDELENKLI